MKIRLLITALICAMALSACNNRKSNDTTSNESISDKFLTESSSDSEAEYETKTSFKLTGRWKFIEIDEKEEKASGLNYGSYRAAHENDDYSKIYDFGENSIGYCETDDVYFPYYLGYTEGHSAYGNNNLGLTFYTDDPDGNYNTGKIWFRNQASLVARVAEGTLYCEKYILVRISDDTKITAVPKDKEIFENLPGKWEAQDSSGGKITYYLFADGSAWISQINSSGENNTFYSNYGVLNGTMYIELFSDGIQKSGITLSGDKMKLDGIANFTRTEKEGYETSNNKEISIN